MGEKEQLDAVIAKLEMELKQLKNNHASASGGAAASDVPLASEKEEKAVEEEEDPASAFLDWSRQQAVLDAELEEQLRARVAAAELVNAELEQHIDTLQRVGAARRRVGADTASLLRSIDERHHEQRRLLTAMRREFNRVLRSIHSEPGFMSVSRLLDVLITQFQDAPDQPYVPVTDDMLPEHLSLLERAGIVRFDTQTDERRVRLVDHAADLRAERLATHLENVPPERAPASSSGQRQ